MQASVSVVIPVYNQSHLTKRCLDSLLRHSRCLREVWVVDNASKDDTGQVLLDYSIKFLEKKIDFRMITNESNVGFGRACNQGLRNMTGEYRAVLNNDTWLMPHWDQALVEALKEFDADCVGPYFYEKQEHVEEKLLSLAKNFSTRNRFRIREHFVPILFMLSPKAYELLKFDHGGVFDERFFVTYEDTDLKERMNKAKLRYIQTGSCFIWHYSKGTRGSLPSRYEEEGLLIFIKKWGFDPRLQEHTFLAKMKRKWYKIKEHYGYF